MPNELVICADDYAISSGTSAVIRDLLSRGAINATTCLVETPTWQQEARALRELADASPRLAVGLHLNLTERFGSPAVPAAVKSVPAWVANGCMPSDRSLEASVLASFRAQWTSFVACYGRAPDFLDGHHHVHLIETPRRAPFALIGETNFSGWVRQCRSNAKRIRGQSWLLDRLSARLSERARSLGVRTNSGFGGLRWFRPSEDVFRLWQTDLAAMADTGGLLIVHPGTTGSPLGTEVIDQYRISEARMLLNPAAAEAIANAGLKLATRAAAPAWG